MIDNINGTSNIVAWDGQNWISISSNYQIGTITALYFDMISMNLFVGTSSWIDLSSPQLEYYIAKWNKTNWNTIGPYFNNSGLFGSYASLDGLVVDNNGTLYVSGFTSAFSCIPFCKLIEKNLTADILQVCSPFVFISNFGSQICKINSIVFDSNNEQIYFVGDFTTLINSTTAEIVSFGSYSNSSLNIFSSTTDFNVIYFEPTSNSLYVGGSFSSINNTLVNGIAKLAPTPIETTQPPTTSSPTITALPTTNFAPTTIIPQTNSSVNQTTISTKKNESTNSIQPNQQQNQSNQNNNNSTIIISTVITICVSLKIIIFIEKF